MNTIPRISTLTLFAAAAVACGGPDFDETDTGPVDPAAPTAPTEPNAPVDPVDPVDPSEPVDPVDPVDPTDPVDPSEPGVDPALVAEFDNDALRNPAVSTFLSITGNRRLDHTGQISADQGDAEDWVEFELPNNSNPAHRITVELQCAFITDGLDEGQVRVTLFEDGEEETTLTAACNEGPRDLTVDNGKVQSARIYFSVAPEAQTLVDYTLSVVGFR